MCQGMREESWCVACGRSDAHSRAWCTTNVWVGGEGTWRVGVLATPRWRAPMSVCGTDRVAHGKEEEEEEEERREEAHEKEEGRQAGGERGGARRVAEEEGGTNVFRVA